MFSSLLSFLAIEKLDTFGSMGYLEQLDGKFG
jgi:hypothetical protein